MLLIPVNKMDGMIKKNAVIFGIQKGRGRKSLSR